MMTLTGDSSARTTRSTAQAAAEDSESMEISDEEEVDDADDDDEPLPTAIGPIAKQFAQVGLEEQKAETERLYDFFHLAKPDFFKLNGEQGATTALIHVPATRLVRLVYGIAVGNPGITPGLLDNKPLGLVGDVSDQRSAPNAMRLYTSHMTTHNF